jgi:hypothetical protein
MLEKESFCFFDKYDLAEYKSPLLLFFFILLLLFFTVKGSLYCEMIFCFPEKKKQKEDEYVKYS